jgi:NTE family protein
MGPRILACAVAVLCALVQVACGSFPVNPKLVKYDPSAGYRFDQPKDEGDPRDEMFVILVFSGGGTRAAALAYGVLEALRDTKIQWQGRTTSVLDEADVISSISGGSFPAAYYGLRGAKTFDEFPDKFLYRAIQSDLVGLALNPTNWPKLSGGSYGRSDLAAEFYDREVFGGATYADLIAQHKRPFVILNATDLSIGTRFPFIQDQFDLLCSDLSGVPLARAAAASSAFPGGLTPLTFQNYAGTCGYSQPAWVDKAIKDHKSRVNARRTARAERRLDYTDTEHPRKYIHLTDGGVADNIGLREPLTAIAGVDNSWSVLTRINLKQVNKLVVIVVNAGTIPSTERDKSPAIPGLVDTVTSVATVPLDNYSFDTLELLRATVSEFNEETRLISGCKQLAAAKGPQCTLDIPTPHQVEFYSVEVAFEYIENAQDRNYFKTLPTTFKLPRETVDRLRAIGRQLLSEDPQFKKLLESVHGCLPASGQTC